MQRDRDAVSISDEEGTPLTTHLMQTMATGAQSCRILRILMQAIASCRATGGKDKGLERSTNEAIAEMKNQKGPKAMRTDVEA